MAAGVLSAQPDKPQPRMPLKCPFPVLVLLACVLFATEPSHAAEVDKGQVKVIASGWETMAHGGIGDFPPANTLDGKVTVESSWRAEGPGAWIQWDLGAATKLRSIGLAFLFGDKRTYIFDLLVTADPAALRDWRPVQLQAKSTGASLDFEWFNTDATPVRHIRLVGYGNTSEKFPRWTNLTEATFLAD
jgi:hypothetical protein